MRILDKYILKELAIPLFFCIAGGLVFYTVFDLFSCIDDLQRNGAGLKGIVLFNLAKMPELLVLILPPALLLALLYAISNHARYNEIVAMRAAGISVWRICIPYLCVGVLLGGVLFYLNEEWVPRGSRIAKSIRKGEKATPDKVYEKVNFSNLQEGRVWNIAEYHAKEKEMIRPSVEFRSIEPGGWTPETGNIIKLMAEKAVWKEKQPKDGVWEFFQVQLFTYGPQGLESKIPVPEKFDSLEVPELTDTPEEIESEIFISGFDSFKSARRANLSLSEISLYLSLHPGMKNEIITKIKTLYYARIASPFTCLIVVLVALPFGLQSGRRNVFVGVASSIVICFCFFLLNEVSLALGAGGYLYPWASAWLPNLLFGIGGLVAIKNLA